MSRLVFETLVDQMQSNGHILPENIEQYSGKETEAMRSYLVVKTWPQQFLFS